MKKILNTLKKNKERDIKSFAVLIDPDETPSSNLVKMASEGSAFGLDFFFVGGSILLSDNFEPTIQVLKDHCDIPIVIFPGSNLQISPIADGILLLSLISGRNPDLLIGQHVASAAKLKNSKLEVIPTGYILIGSGVDTSVAYISNTTPIPETKTPIAVSTAIAGELLGLQLIYLEAGSGKSRVVPETMIRSVKESIICPIIIGGGIDSAEKAKSSFISGADLLVIGNGIQHNMNLLKEVCELKNTMNKELNIH
ncbi:MAG: geranylgeranylglyceryl/heptaprenylglyceryl phosphate synthase [Bacteroidota bacterium]